MHAQSDQSKMCKPEQIEAYLCEQLTGAEEAEFVLHLDACSACCQLIETTAAERATWDSIQTHLNDDGYDSTSWTDNEPPADATQVVSLQIKTVLSLLAPTDDPHMLGRLGGYEISGVVGTGGMGIVLKGYDSALDRVVAIKVLAPHLASSGAAKQRFAREAKAAAAVLHPNVIAIHSVSNDAELPYLVMPYVRGSSLQRRLDQHGPFAVREVLRVGCQIAAGLAAAHAQGLVHRDIKPANILLEEGIERVTITDFGLARAVDDATLTRSGVIAGTPQYMSPEQATGDAIDARSDLFSLGSVLYAMCTGRAPFRSETTYGVLRRITDENVRSIREINPDIPEWLCRLIALLHEKRPANRLQSAAETELLMQQCLAHLEQPRQNALPVCLLPNKRMRLRSSLLILCCVLCGLAGFIAMSMFGPDEKLNSEKLASGARATEAVAVPGIDNAPASNPWEDDLAELLQAVGRDIEQLEHRLEVFP